MKPGFFLHLSNRPLFLYQTLLESISTPLPNPLTPECLVIQNRGVRDWLSIQLAQDLGTCTNVDFIYPKTYIHQLFKHSLKDAKKLAIFEAPGMTWALMKMLPTLEGQLSFQHLIDYFEADQSGIKCFQLCHQIARSFERYQIYDDNLLALWEGGEENHWQAQLWRLFLRRFGAHSIPEMKYQLIQLIQEQGDKISLPARINVFGLNSLPPSYIEIYQALSTLTQLNIYQYTPAKEEVHHPLWLHSGQMNRDLIPELQSCATEVYCHFEPRALNHTLHVLQACLENQSLTVGQVSNHSSVQIHNCFSPMREVQVLHDQLLSLLEKDKTVALNDIAVITPEIDVYAPLIHAVFSSSSPTLPFTIVGQSVYQQSSLVHVLFSILNIRNSRWEASTVMSILNHPVVYRKFGFREEDLELLFNWIKESNIRWGKDLEHTQELGFHEMHINTWTFGLERLMLGYAMPLGEEEIFANILPYDHVEGSSALLLGKLYTFIEALKQVFEFAREPQKALGWRHFIQGVLEQFFRPLDHQEQDLHLIRVALSTIERDFRACHFDLPIALDVMEYELGKQLQHMLYPARSFDGRITFGPIDLVGQRPLKVLCLLGLGDQIFPAKDSLERYYTPERDEVSSETSQRNQDRHYFIHGLLHTSQTLYLSYVGQSIRDNQENAPSLVITEVQDAIKGMEAVKQLREVKHPLNPYHSRYFNPASSLFSYSQNYLDIYCATKDNSRFIPSFFLNPLPPLSDEHRTIEISQLIRFFKDPARAFIMDRLRIFERDDIEVLEDREPFSLSGLDNYLIYNDLVAFALSGRDLSQLYDFMKATGKLPYASIGRILFDQMVLEARRFAVDYQANLVGGELEPLSVDLKIDDFRLFGQLDQIYENGLFRYRYTDIKVKDRMETWILFLVLKMMNPSNIKQEALFWAKKWHIFYDDVHDPLKHLKTLVNIYWQGMTEPLPLMPESSYSYARTLLKGGSSDEAQYEARKKFDKDTRYSQFNQWCFDRDELDSPRFAELALKVYDPLYQCQQERKH